MKLIDPVAHETIRRAHKEVLRKHEKSGTEARVDKSQSPGPIAKPGSRVRIKSGEITNEEGTQLAQDVGGETARISGAPYVSTAGPNKGKIVQPVEIDGSRTLVGVTTDRLSSADSSGHSSARVGWSRNYEKAFDKIFGNKARR